MRFKLFLALFITCCAAVPAVAQKVLSEGTLTYDVSVQTGSAEPKMADMFDGARATVFLKGSHSRSELTSTLGTSTTIFDSKDGMGVVLREYGSQKILIKLNRDNWKDKNRKYDGITFETTGETKAINGYPCEKMIAHLKDGASFIIWFTRQVRIENNDYDGLFRTMPGLPMEYESMAGGLRIRYTLAKISFDPVPVQKFEFPKSGYRELTYEESIRVGGTN
jgi:GLPGLI family protein